MEGALVRRSRHLSTCECTERVRRKKGERA